MAKVYLIVTPDHYLKFYSWHKRWRKSINMKMEGHQVVWGSYKESNIGSFIKTLKKLRAKLQLRKENALETA